jgi:hypothetical protein
LEVIDMRVFGSIMNRIMEDSTQPAPEVGQGATLLFYSDRHACTVIEVAKNGKTIKVQEDTATRTDGNGMSDSQSYSYAPDPKGTVYTFTLRKNGYWVKKGEGINSGTRLGLGFRQAYHDYSF